MTNSSWTTYLTQAWSKSQDQLGAVASQVLTQVLSLDVDIGKKTLREGYLRLQTTSGVIWTWSQRCLKDLSHMCPHAQISVLLLSLLALVTIYNLAAKVFDVTTLKTAEVPGHADTLKELLKSKNYDINYQLPLTGLTLLLCACLSGQRSVVNYLLDRGANVKMCTTEGDGALSLAMFGVFNAHDQDVMLLQDLIDSGCEVNKQNNAGYTPLHTAARNGNLTVIKLLLKNGADPNIASYSGVCPIDSATNAGQVEAADALQVNLEDSYASDSLKSPGTPTLARLGLLNPRKGHLLESPAPRSSKRKVFRIT